MVEIAVNGTSAVDFWHSLQPDQLNFDLPSALKWHSDPLALASTEWWGPKVKSPAKQQQYPCVHVYTIESGFSISIGNGNGNGNGDGSGSGCGINIGFDIDSDINIDIALLNAFIKTKSAKPK